LYRQLASSESATDDIAALPYSYVECIQRSSLKLYTGMGYIIFILCVIVAIFARRTELMIFATRGINSNVDYPTYLINTEGAQLMDDEADKKTSGVESKRLSSTELKVTIQNAMEEVNKQKLHHVHNSYRKRIPLIVYGHFIILKSHVMTWLVNCINSNSKKIRRDSVALDHDATLQNIKIKHKVKESVKQRSQLNKEKELIHTLKAMKTRVKSEEKAHIAALTVQSHAAHGRFTDNAEERSDVWSHVNNFFHPNSSASGAATTSDHHAPTSSNVESIESLSSSRRMLDMKKAVDDISSAYFFSHPALFFDFVEALNMVVSFYLALWLTNFGSACYQTPYVGNWMVASLAPGLICFVIYLYIVRTAALLRAITFFDSDIAKETIEEAEDIQSLGEQLRERLNKKLAEIGGKHEQELKILFRQADDDGSMCLSRSEFQVMMEALDITYSKKRWAQIFREIDRNYDDNISFEEFFLFIYPKNDNAIAAERKRLKLVRERVRSKSIVAVTNGKKSISEQIPQTFRQPSSSTSFDRSKIVAINEDMSHNSYNGEDVEDSVRAQSTTATAALVDIEDCGDMTAYGV
jgi:Ca2+-binding EF-hand superfamily protein